MIRKLLSFMTFGLVAVSMAASVAKAGAFATDFSSLPAGSQLFNSAYLSGGVLRLTDAVNMQTGQLFVDDLDGGAPVTQLKVTFGMLIGGGTEGPADGLSFSFASDLPTPSTPYGNPGEEGGGTGLIISFDTWENGPSDPIAIEVFYGGVLKGRVAFQSSQGPLGSAFYDVTIKLDADGTLDLFYGFYGPSPVFANLQTGYAPISGGQFAFGARTGAANDNHWIDDLSIATNSAAPEPTTLSLLGLGLAGLAATRRRKQ